MILEKINGGLAIGFVHAKEDVVVRGLDHFAPEQFLILGQETKEIPIGTDSGGL